jgi:hypothetical protein
MIACAREGQSIDKDAKMKTRRRIATMACILIGMLAGALQAATPVDPAATPEAKNLLDYIYSIYEKKILSGQEETNNCGQPSNTEMNYLMTNTGKYPAIRSMDMNDAWTCGATQRSIDWWNAGGIVMFGWHWGAPGHQNSYDSSMIHVSINTVLTTGTPEYASLIRRLDSTAAQIKILQNANVPIIWRPFHECGTNNWFWWSLDGGANYVRLWKFMFNYFTQTKGLHNMVWLLPYNGGPDASYWPGAGYVDLGGADNYASAGDHGPMTSIFSSVKNIVGNTMPIALHENGPIPDPGQLQSTGTNWFMFSTWDGDYLMSTSYNSISFLNSTYNNAYVITRDKVPDLKNATPRPVANVDKFLLEAENAELTGGAVSVSDAGSSNGAYVNLEGGNIVWTDSLTKSGIYDVVLRMSSPFGTKTNGFSVDSDSSSFTVDSSATYQTIKVATAIALEPGTHTFTLTAKWGWIDVDYLQLVPSSTTALESPSQSAHPQVRAVAEGIFATNLVGIRQIRIMDATGRRLALVQPQGISETIPLKEHGILFLAFEEGSGAVSHTRIVLP